MEGGNKEARRPGRKMPFSSILPDSFQLSSPWAIPTPVNSIHHCLCKTKSDPATTTQNPPWSPPDQAGGPARLLPGSPIYPVTVPHFPTLLLPPPPAIPKAWNVLSLVPLCLESHSKLSSTWPLREPFPALWVGFLQLPTSQHLFTAFTAGHSCMRTGTRAPPGYTLPGTR